MIVHLVNYPKTSRAVRVAWSLGAMEVWLDTSSRPKREHLHSARSMPCCTAPCHDAADLLVLEVGAAQISEVEWPRVGRIAVGGPGHTFLRREYPEAQWAGIVIRPPCLIGDQALAIALWEWRLHCRS